MTKSAEELVEDRGKRYGSFIGNAKVAQDLKSVVLPGLTARMHAQEVPEAQQHLIVEGMEMILHKISRLVNGDPTYLDSWDDIKGYAHIVGRDLRELGVEE